MGFWDRFLEKRALDQWAHDYGPDLLFLTGSALREIQWLVGRMSSPPLTIAQIRAKSPEQLARVLEHRREKMIEVLRRHEDRRELIIAALDLVQRFGIGILPLLFGI